MEIVRYRAGEAIRWLQTGAINIRKTANAKGRSIVKQSGVDQRPLTENFMTAAGALIEYGKSTYADIIHRQAEAHEYILQDKHFDIVRGNSIKVIHYDRVKAIKLDNDRATLTLEKGSLVIKPFAHIVAGRVRVPIGWSRNGIEVPFELLVEELAARCKLELEEE